MFLYVNIKTIPTQNENVKHLLDAQIRQNPITAKMSEEHLADALQRAVEQTAYRPEGEMVIIAAGMGDDDPLVFFRSDDTESSENALLEDFVFWLKDSVYVNDLDAIVGYDIKSFVLPRLFQRATVYDIALPQYWPTPIVDYKSYLAQWGIPIHDIMELFSPATSIDLPMMACVLGIEASSSLLSNNESVYLLWRTGQDEAVKQLCKEELEVIRTIAKRMFQ